MFQFSKLFLYSHSTLTHDYVSQKDNDITKKSNMTKIDMTDIESKYHFMKSWTWQTSLFSEV